MRRFVALETVNTIIDGDFLRLEKGSEYHLTMRQAVDLLSVGYVREIEVAQQEAAMVEAPEKAILKSPKGRKL